MFAAGPVLCYIYTIKFYAIPFIAEGGEIYEQKA